MHPYNRIDIEIAQSNIIYRLQLSGMKYFGAGFAPWNQGRYHVAKNGFILASEHPGQLRCYPRIGKLSLPSEDWVPEYMSVTDIIEIRIDREPLVDLYVEFMIEALREYETAARLFDEVTNK